MDVLNSTCHFWKIMYLWKTQPSQVNISSSIKSKSFSNKVLFLLWRSYFLDVFLSKSIYSPYSFIQKILFLSKLKIMKISLSILWDFLFVQALVDLREREYSQCQFYCKWKQIKTIEVKLNKVITWKTPNNNQTGTSI